MERRRNRLSRRAFVVAQVRLDSGCWRGVGGCRGVGARIRSAKLNDYRASLHASRG
jgi:hypothetical protein